MLGLTYLDSERRADVEFGSTRLDDYLFPPVDLQTDTNGKSYNV